MALPSFVFALAAGLLGIALVLALPFELRFGLRLRDRAGTTEAGPSRAPAPTGEGASAAPRVWTSGYQPRGRAIVEVRAPGGITVWRICRRVTSPRAWREAPELLVALARSARPGRGFLRPPAGGVELAGALAALAGRARWRRLAWHTTVGLPDAAATALAAGLLWTAKANLAALATRRLRLGPGLPRYSVATDFEGGSSRTAVHGIATLRLGHIILASPGLARALGRTWWAGRSRRRRRTRAGPNPGGDAGGASNPRPDEDGHGEHSRNG